jgi:hypothetical protein
LKKDIRGVTKLERLGKCGITDKRRPVIPVCGPKGLAYATPSDAAARTKKGLKSGYKLGTKRGE